MNYFIDWGAHAGAQAEKFYKATLWQGEHVMVGLNCLEPSQTQSVHAHQDADKFYFVLEGKGWFTVGDEERSAAPGSLIVAPAGVPHGVTNTSDERLSLLVAIAPWHESPSPGSRNGVSSPTKQNTRKLLGKGPKQFWTSGFFLSANSWTWGVE